MTVRFHDSLRTNAPKVLVLRVNPVFVLPVGAPHASPAASSLDQSRVREQIPNTARTFNSRIGKSMNPVLRNRQPRVECHPLDPRVEVLTRHDGGSLAQRNTQFVETLLGADGVVIAGQAASHCVKSSIDDLLDDSEFSSSCPDQRNALGN